MSELAFSLGRFGFIALLWLFIFFIIRAVRLDMTPSESRNPVLFRRRAREQAPSAPTRGRRRGATRLVITEGPLAGSTVPLTPTSITIGRSPSCTLVLEDSYASSQHARIFPGEASWWLEDLGSTNGTTLGGAPVHGTVELPMGVPVRIGQTTLELRP